MNRFFYILFLALLFSCNQTWAPTEIVEEKASSEPALKTPEGDFLSPVDYNLIIEKKLPDTQIEIVDLGELNLPSGRIVVCDPLVGTDSEPLTRTVKPGKYPVRVFSATTDEFTDRYALAQLLFSDEPAEKWILALTGSDDTSPLTSIDSYIGFPVDAGLGSFFDYETEKKYLEFDEAFMNKNPEKNIYDDLLEDEFKKNAKNPQDPNDVGNWVNFTIPGTENNITMFNSGFGDGYYPAYWGIGKNGETVSLVIDFFVLLTE